MFKNVINIWKRVLPFSAKQPLYILAAFYILAPGSGLPFSQTALADQAFDTNHAARLVWSTMIAIEQANRTGNYSVLRDNSASSFQQANNPATLASLFERLRNTNFDLSNTLLLSPDYSIPPTVRKDGLLRMRGRFELRPTPVNFDLMFQLESGKWRLFGIAVVAGNPNKQAQK